MFDGHWQRLLHIIKLLSVKCQVQEFHKNRNKWRHKCLASCLKRGEGGVERKQGDNDNENDNDNEWKMEFSEM